MKTQIASALLVSASALLLVGYTTVSAREHVDAIVPQPLIAGAFAPAPLEECSRPDIVIGTALQTSAVSRASAEQAAGTMGVRGQAAISLLTTVTVGTRTGSVATPAEALVDGHGSAIVDRPAWVLVFRNQTVRSPSNGAYIPGARQASSPRLMSALASVVDAQTGEFLRGWGCAWAK